jgi:hypothetical protein
MLTYQTASRERVTDARDDCRSRKGSTSRWLLLPTARARAAADIFDAERTHES